MSVSEFLEKLSKFNRKELREIANRALELSWDEAEREAMEIAEACCLESNRSLAADEMLHDLPCLTSEQRTQLIERACELNRIEAEREAIAVPVGGV